MPFYDYQCSVCKKETSRFKSIDDRREVYHCGQRCILLISAPYIIPSFKEHFNVGLGQKITSRHQKKEVMKRLNCEEVGNDGADKIKRRRKELLHASH